MGGNGVVFEASELIDGRLTGKTYAVKVLKQLAPARVDRFNNEVRVLKELSSPYISAYTAAGQVTVTPQVPGASDEAVPWVAMQLGGTNMRQHVEEAGPLTLAQLKSITFGMCAAVEPPAHERLYPSRHQARQLCVAQRTEYCATNDRLWNR
jgi:serine/threonine protein kinase